MEAEGSDPEDYQKQLQMTALSRSARNIVAQDFHKAGGGDKSTQRDAGKKRPTDPVEIAKALIAGKGYQQSFMRDLEEFIVERLSPEQCSDKNRPNSSQTTPPPAKRRRFFNSQDHDKENNKNHHQEASSHKDGQTTEDRRHINKQMRDIFQMMAQHYSEQLIKDSKGSVDSPGHEGSLKELEKILRNNHELTISIKDSNASSVKYGNGDSGLDDEEEDDELLNKDQEGTKSKRKSFVPRKMEPRNNLAVWNQIRDKHLSRLMSPKKAKCFTCAKRQSLLNIPHYSTSSLILHKLWRHYKCSHSCQKCGQQFRQGYKLHLHLRLKHC